MIEATRSGQVHLTGLRLLAPHLTAENHCEVLAQAAGKTKRGIEELVARLAPQPAVASTIRKLPERPAPAPAEPLALALDPAPARPPRREDHRRAIAPLAEKTYRVEFTATRNFTTSSDRHRTCSGTVFRMETWPASWTGRSIC